MLYKICELKVENLSHELQDGNLSRVLIFIIGIYKELTEVATGGVLPNNASLTISQNSQSSHLSQSLFFNKVAYYKEHL